MREKHHIEVAPSWPGLKERLFRTGNFGNINKPEIDRFLHALELTLEELK
jgi:aspartate aminotransferase-like enzyme